MDSKLPPLNLTFSKTLSQTNCDVSKAVTDFHNHVSEATKNNPRITEDTLYECCTDYLKVVSSTSPEKQAHLVDFLLKIREGDGKNQKFQTEQGEVTMKDLPFLGWGMRSMWNDSLTAKSSPEVAEAWVHRNAFAARITAISKPGDCLDYSLYCLWSMRSALEEAPEENTHAALVRAAAQWMLYAAREIRKRAVDGWSYDGKMGKAGSAVEGKDWKGHSEERWEFWVERFKKVRDGGADEQTKSVVEKALKCTEEAE